MTKKLKCIVVDDDSFAVEVMKDNFRNSAYGELTHSFLSSKKFLAAAPTIDYDIIFLDISMPDIDGLSVARQVSDKHVVFVTGMEEKLKEATEFCPLGILSKPIAKNKLEKILETAYKVVAGNEVLKREKEYALFNIAESKEKVVLFIPDIQYVTIDEDDYRNKKAYLKGGKRVTLMNCTLESIRQQSVSLMQVNKWDLVSLTAIKSISHDNITLKINNENGKEKQVTFSRLYKKNLKNILY